MRTPLCRHSRPAVEAAGSVLTVYCSLVQLGALTYGTQCSSIAGSSHCVLRATDFTSDPSVSRGESPYKT